MLIFLQIENLSSTLAPILIELLQLNTPAGVQMAIKQVIYLFVCLAASPLMEIFIRFLSCIIEHIMHWPSLQ